MVSCASHEQCKQPSTTPLPTRVVRLGSGPEDIALQETVGRYGEYAALSYCWGKDKTLHKTIHENYGAMKASIPSCKLPATLKDAITLARELGFRYIWIDSLCIIQNDRKDWEKEAARMGHYYQNAALTIAASWSTSASSGLFHDRPVISAPQILQFRGMDGMSYPIIAQARGQRLQTAALHEQLGPLSDRGWTFQENLLSARVIHFTNSQLIWECTTELLSEDTYPIQGLYDGLIGDFRKHRQGDDFDRWSHFVEIYSRRELTNPNDRLPAISGVAALFQQETGHEYAAGLWKDHMSTHLMWVNDMEGDMSDATLSGPTWSWASIKGGVKTAAVWLRSLPFNPLCVVHDTLTTPVGENPFGQVERGTVIVTGPVLQMDMQWDGILSEFDLPWYRLLHDQEPDIYFVPDSNLEPVTVNIGSESVLQTSHRSQKPPMALKATIWCLWLLKSDPPEELKERNQLWFMCLYGLVLAPTRDFGRDKTYVRIGSVMTKTTRLLGESNTATLTIV